MYAIVQKRRWYFLISGILIALSAAAMVVSAIRFGEPLRIGIDFAGGSIFVVQFEQEADADAIREAFAQRDIDSPIIQPRGAPEENTWQIRTREVTANEAGQLLDTLEEQVAPINENTLQFDTVEPAIGGEVTRAAGLAILVASVVIVAFMWFSFRRVPNAFRYGVCTIVGMLHNLIITFGFYSLMGIAAGWEVDALFLTAILTVIGFSVQDVIVVFDRIRENIPKYRREPFETIVNRSILETLHRSLATQLNAMFVMVAI
ncbi:MAG: protein translocase subunit SecF, partial [Chloroflexi bacterium]|nr:protein translocase subunit SecF [Chloroflexota bacterium]